MIRILHIAKATFVLVACLPPMAALAQSDKPEEGKVYLINRNTNTNAYIYESSARLTAGPADKTQKQYWRFIPTGTADHYYVQNVASGLYIQSTNLPAQNGQTQQVQCGTTPVELEVKANTTSSFTGYYYICSTDQTIDVQADKTLGLNFEAATNRIVAFSVRYNRGNSYWEFHATDYDYIAPEPDVRSDYSRQLGVYNLPCGTVGTAYFTALDVEGRAVTDEVHYSATAKPSAYYNPLRTDRLTLVPGEEATLSYAAAKTDGNYKTTAYFDWDADGIFEDARELGTAATGQLSFTVPDTARCKSARIRVRLTDNGMDDAEDAVHGYIYDLLANVQKADATQRTFVAESCDTLRGTVSAVLPDEATDSVGRGRHHITAPYGTQFTLTAEPKGNAAFKGWAIDGTVVSTKASYTLEATQSVTLTALFSPNTQTTDAVSPVVCDPRTLRSTEAYNVTGRRINPKYHRGVYIQGGKKRIR